MSEPIKPESIFTYLGFKPEEITTEDIFKTQFESKFGVKDLLLKDPKFTGEIFGKRLGSVEAKAKAHFKKMGIEFVPDEIKDKQVEDIIELGLQKTAELNKKAMDDYDKSTKGTVDDQVKQWKEKYTSVESKLKDTEGLLTKTSSEFEGFKKEQVTRAKSDTINNFRKDAIKKLDFKQDITAVERMGFESVLNDKYKFDIDDIGNPFVSYKNGQRIPSKKTTATFMTADEILQEELIANKLAKITAQGGKAVPRPGPLPVDNGVEKKSELYITPRARAASAAPAVKITL